MRRAADLEHWAAFGASFAEFERLLTGLATGAQGRPPASVIVLGGDIHHSYLATVDFPAGTNPRSAVYQAVCSPIHNVLPGSFRLGQQLPTSRVGGLAGDALARLAGVRRPRIGWRTTCGPWFHNMLSALEFEGCRARIRFDRTVCDPAGVPHLQSVCEAGPQLRTIAAVRSRSLLDTPATGTGLPHWAIWRKYFYGRRQTGG